MHLDLDLAVPGAGLAPTAPRAGHVEGEPSGRVAADPRLGDLGEQGPDVVEHADVGRRVRPGGSPDRRLVDVDDLVDLLPSGQPPVLSRDHPRPVDLHLEPAVEDLLDQGRLPGPAHPGHADEGAQRHGHVDALQVVLPGSLDLEPAPGRLPPHLGGGDGSPAGEVGPGHRIGVTEQPREGPRVHDLAPSLPRPPPDVPHVIGCLHGGLVVLDHDERVPQVPQAEQRVDEPPVVPLVQPDGRFVQDVQDPHEPGPDLGGQADPLGLSPGEGGRGPVERQVVEPHVDEELEPRPDLLEDPLRDHVLAFGEVDPVEEGDLVLHGLRGELPDVDPSDGDR